MAVTFVEYPKFILKNYSEFFRTNKAKDHRENRTNIYKEYEFWWKHICGNIFVETYAQLNDKTQICIINY